MLEDNWPDDIKLQMAVRLKKGGFAHQSSSMCCGVWHATLTIVSNKNTEAGS